MFPRTLPLFGLLVLILASPLWGQASDIPVDCSAAPVIGQDFAICFPTCPPLCLPDPGGISLHTDFALPPALPSGDSLDSVVLTKGTFVDPWRVSASIASPQIILDVKGLGNMPDRFGEFVGLARYLSARVLSVTVTNRSADVWTGFELELRTVLNTPSDKKDGLSFGKVAAGPEAIDLYKPPNLLNTPCAGSGWDFPCSGRFQKLTFNKGLESIG